MITEDYVSFETAKLLKEKGFNEKTYRCYNLCTEEHELSDVDDVAYNNWELADDGAAAPTLQMVMKWLREEYKLEVRSTYDYDKDSWWGNINPMFEETDENSDIYQKALRFDYQGKSYEEAVETVINFCLENLI